MKKYYWSRVLLLMFLIYITIMSTSDVVSAQNNSSSSLNTIRVGVVMDMAIGEPALLSISMALSDFYATTVGRNYTTRIALTTRDSNGTAIGAAAAALDLLKNVEVKAIIGPLFSSQASFLIDLGDQAQVPIVTFSATSPSLSSLRSPFFIRATLNDSSQVHAISAIIKSFGWREIVLIYVDNEFGEGIIPYLTGALENVNTRVPYMSIIPSLATDDQIELELYKLKSMQTRVFVVHMITPLGSRLFTKAKQLGMMSEDYVWIITDGMTNELDLMDPSVVDSMLGVIGLKPYVPESNELDQFKVRFKRSLLFSNSTTLSPDVNIFVLRAYDCATALAMAVEKAKLTNVRFEKSNSSRNSTDLEAFGVSTEGPNLIQALSSTTFKGLAGDFRLDVSGQLQSPPYEIVNVVGRGARGIGYWTEDNGIVRELNFTNTSTKNYSTSASAFRSIIWPGDRISPPKGWVVSTNGKKLRIGVPVKSGFTEFVRVTWNLDNSTKVEGYCIDVFDAVMAAMPYGVQYTYVPFANAEHRAAGSYDDLTYQVKLGNYDAIVGDVTIVANRSEYVDFTLPFTQSGFFMVAPIHDTMSKDALVFLKPLTKKLWITTFCSFVFIGISIWILEHRVNKDFRGTTLNQAGLVFWFAFSTMVFAQKEKVVNNWSRFVLIIWFLLVLILTQSYTANLTTMLTIKQLQPTVTDINSLISNNDYVGLQKGSFVFGKLKKLKFEESRLLEYNSIEEMHELFLKGSGNGGIAAAFDEIPYVKLFLGKYCSEYAMVDPQYKTDGFGFVFPIGSPLVPDVSRAILNVTESGTKIEEIERTWFGGQTKCEDPKPHPNSLDIESFVLLFGIVGGAAIFAVIAYFSWFIYKNWSIVANNNNNNNDNNDNNDDGDNNNNNQRTVREIIAELFKKFLEKDRTAADFINDNDNGGEVAVVPPPPNVPNPAVPLPPDVPIPVVLPPPHVPADEPIALVALVPDEPEIGPREIGVHEG